MPQPSPSASSQIVLITSKSLINEWLHKYVGAMIVVGLVVASFVIWHIAVDCCGDIVKFKAAITFSKQIQFITEKGNRGAIISDFANKI